MMYVDLDTLKIVSHQFLQRKHAVYNREREFTADELAAMNAAPLTEPVTPSGDIATGKAVLVNGVYEREYRALTAVEIVNQAKRDRDALKTAPIAVDVSAGLGLVFDMDDQARININNTLEAWDAINAAVGGTGEIAWTLADNTEIMVTVMDLVAVKTAATLRGLQAHMDYQAIKAANP